MKMPDRIVSLVPSLTELVARLGAAGRLVGRTRFCDEPRDVVERVPAVGGTKDPDIGRIRELAPDLVVANREENRRDDVEALRQAGLEVLVTDPVSVTGAVQMVREIGSILGRLARAEELATEVEQLLAVPASTSARVFVAIWKHPLMALGGETYGSDLLAHCGAVNVLGGRSRYPEVTLEEVRELRPDLILLPDEPYRFRESDVAAFSEIAPARLVDGRLLWWYGPRMPAAIRTIRALVTESLR